MDRAEQMQRRFEVPVMIAAVLVIPGDGTGPEPTLAHPRGGREWCLNTAIWLVFVAELAAILAVAPHRWQWIKTHPLDPLIVLLTPPLMPSSLQAARLAAASVAAARATGPGCAPTLLRSSG